jgi:hypothetical protein
MSSLLPFVVIPMETTSTQLASTKPFLLAAIKMTASIHHARCMQGQLYKLMRHISDYMIMRSQRSLDLLQGIIVILSYYHHHCFMHSNMTNLAHLAMSLVFDLGMNRHPRIVERTKLMMLNPDKIPSRTNEERRALLGVWYILSS